MKNYELTPREEEQFQKLVEQKRDLLKLALLKTNVPYNSRDEFYSYALEGLLVSYKILKNGDIEEKDFDKFAFVTMKRKIIDEFRYREREKFKIATTVEDWQNVLAFSTEDTRFVEVEFYQIIQNNLTTNEKKFFHHYLKTKDVNLVAKELKIPKSSAYKMLAKIRKTVSKILLEK